MAEYFAHVIARLIVSYLTLLVISLIILAGCWIIADYSSMLAFIHSVSDNAFAEFVVWMPFVLSWFNSSETNNNRTSYKFDGHESHHNFTLSKFSLEETKYNPSTGLPMIGGIGGIDVSGKAYGQL